MMRSLFSGVAGLRTHQSRMDVIGNNIANVNTIGFKSSAVTFQDLMYQNSSGASGATDTLGGVNAKQTGLGVSTGSTKISIESGGAAQSTGQAFDLRFTDMSSTNFFIVSNGSENLFTRAGSFYIDGAGNLAMTSTGYMVMGWQYDEASGNIIRDTVSPLRIMSPENRTSTPEYTQNMFVSGVLDKNDTDMVSENGYMSSLTVYDNLGYEYTLKFSTKFYSDRDEAGRDELKFTTSLESITNSKNEDILKAYVEDAPDTRSIRDIFGNQKEDQTGPSRERVTYSVSNPAKNKDGSFVTAKINGQDYYLLPTEQPSATLISKNDRTGEYEIMMSASKDAENAPQGYNVATLFGISNAAIENYLAKGAEFAVNKNGELTVTYNAVNYELSFNPQDGSLVGIKGSDGGTSVNMFLSKLGDAFSDVEIDFSAALAYDNGKTSTMGMDRGQLGNISLGAGRKLGTLTGLSVSQDGTIWGSYDNGTNKCLGQIPVSRFANASGLESIGNNVYKATRNSGDFDGIGVDVTADGGQINSGQLEMSNVDLSQEFTDMITTQRGFQANSRIITVSDTMLEELTNLKR